MMKRIFPIILAGLLALALCPVPVNAGIAINLNDTRSGHANTINIEGPETLERTGDVITIDIVDSTMVAAGSANGGATSMATTTLAVPVTFAHVNIDITSADSAFTAKTLADGKKGQILTLHIYTGTNATTVTPTTATAWSVATFNAVDDQLTLLFVDTTTGWVVMSSTSVTLTP